MVTHSAVVGIISDSELLALAPQVWTYERGGSPTLSTCSLSIIKARRLCAESGTLPSLEKLAVAAIFTSPSFQFEGLTGIPRPGAFSITAITSVSTFIAIRVRTLTWVRMSVGSKISPDHKHVTDRHEWPRGLQDWRRVLTRYDRYAHLHDLHRELLAWAVTSPRLKGDIARIAASLTDYVGSAITRSDPLSRP